MASLGSWNLPVGFGPAEEVDVDAADLIGAELHVAGAEAWILRGRRLPVDERAQAIRGGFSKIPRSAWPGEVVIAGEELG